MTTPQKYKILEKVISQIPFKLHNTMYNGNYKYSLNRYYEIIKLVIAKYATNPLIAIITAADIQYYLLDKLRMIYHSEIQANTARIAAIPIIEQKSPEWFRLREGMISASDAGYFLKKCGAGRAMDTLKIKLGLKKYPNSTAPPLMHGNTYEDVTRAIYESRNKVVVEEYGILPAPTSCIGASPDGIITQCLDPNDWECQSRLGRLLEIKNPYSREIDETIKPEYMVQILQQQYTTGIPVCDFVETTIVDKYCRVGNANYKPYQTLDDMLNDKLDQSRTDWQDRIKNHNIPSDNLTKYGYEKGLVVWYQRAYSDNDIRNKYILYPLNGIYNKDIIERWIVDTNSAQFQNGFTFKEVKYWRLDVYSEKTVIYDKELYEGSYVPILCKVWDIIIHCRKIIVESNLAGDRAGDLESYLEELENDVNSPFYNENKMRKMSRKTSSGSMAGITTTYKSSNSTLGDGEEFEIDM